MKKLLVVLFTLLSVYLNAQISINTIQEVSVQDGKNSAITVYHSSGTLYHFQSSESNIYLKKINATNFAPISDGYRLNSTFGGTLNGGFEDPEGNIIFYGQQKVGSQMYGFIFKLNTSTLTLVNLKKIENINIIDGCWGEKNYNLPTQSRNYAFVSSSGKVMISDASLNFNNYQYGINDGLITDISWNSGAHKFMLTGCRTITNQNYSFFASFDCFDSYSTGVYFHNKICFYTDALTNQGYVTHVLLNSGYILIAQSGFLSTNTQQPFVYLSVHSIQMTNPYMSTIASFKRFPLPIGDYFGNIAMINNNQNGNVTLLSNYQNTSNTRYQYLANIVVTNNIANPSFRNISNTYLTFNNLIYNPVDQNGSIHIATGIENSMNYAELALIHNLTTTQCFGTSLLNKTATLTPNYYPITDNYAAMPTTITPTIPQFNIITSFDREGYCAPYHSQLPPPSKSLLSETKNEINITLLESQEFILQGFTGSVQCNIYDMTGKMVYSVSTENDMNNSIPTLSSGIYILKAVDNMGNDKSIKFFKD